ncbi:MAG: WYL domain-containing protein [Anaerolineae bacterium]|nr:WYL domain-containing protein [Anaerolineae bacterium]
MPFLPVLQQAVWEDRKVDLVYRRSDGQQVERRVDAYGLVAKASIWYLVGVEEDRVRVYRVSRVQDDRARRAVRAPAGLRPCDLWASWSAQFEASRARYQPRSGAPVGMPLSSMHSGDHGGVWARRRWAARPLRLSKLRR